jgi:hypothetical protein
MARIHSPSQLGCSRFSEWQRQLKRGRRSYLWAYLGRLAVGKGFLKK